MDTESSSSSTYLTLPSVFGIIGARVLRDALMVYCEPEEHRALSLTCRALYTALSEPSHLCAFADENDRIIALDACHRGNASIAARIACHIADTDYELEQVLVRAIEQRDYTALEFYRPHCKDDTASARCFRAFFEGCTSTENAESDEAIELFEWCCAPLLSGDERTEAVSKFCNSVVFLEYLESLLVSECGWRFVMHYLVGRRNFCVRRLFERQRGAHTSYVAYAHMLLVSERPYRTTEAAVVLFDAYVKKIRSDAETARTCARKHDTRSLENAVAVELNDHLGIGIMRVLIDHCQVPVLRLLFALYDRCYNHCYLQFFNELVSSIKHHAATATLKRVLPVLLFVMNETTVLNHCSRAVNLADRCNHCAQQVDRLLDTICSYALTYNIMPERPRAIVQRDPGAPKKHTLLRAVITGLVRGEAGRLTRANFQAQLPLLCYNPTNPVAQSILLCILYAVPPHHASEALFPNRSRGTHVYISDSDALSHSLNVDLAFPFNMPAHLRSTRLTEPLWLPLLQFEDGVYYLLYDTQHSPLFFSNGDPDHARINTVCTDETTMLYHACKLDSDHMLFVVQRLLELRVDPYIGRPPLYALAKCTHASAPQTCREIVSATRMTLDQRTGRSENTPLHCAVLRNNMAMVRTLLDLGADVTVQNKHGKTPHDLCNSKALKRLLLAHHTATEPKAASCLTTNKRARDDEEEEEEDDDEDDFELAVDELV